MVSTKIPFPPSIDLIVQVDIIYGHIQWSELEVPLSTRTTPLAWHVPLPNEEQNDEKCVHPVRPECSHVK